MISAVFFKLSIFQKDHAEKRVYDSSAAEAESMERAGAPVACPRA
jgi:hypothetical protein